MSHLPYSSPHLRNKYSNRSETESSNPSVQDPQLSQQQKYNQMLLVADELIRAEQFEEGIQKLRLLMEKMNFLKQSKRDYDRKLQLVIIYNMAAAYQKQWNLDECIPLLERFISLTKNTLQDTLKISGSLNLHDNTNKHWFKLKTILVKSLLQYCAVLSQIGEHKKALKIAIEITGEIKTLFRRGFDECQRQIAKKQSHQQKKGSSKRLQSVKTIGADKIQFSYSVLLSARNILQELIKMQTYNEIVEGTYQQIQSEMIEVKSKIYYWKNNPENNIKMLRQSFSTPAQPQSEESKKTSSDRNLLGIKRNNQSWIEEFTIAKVMFMTPINYLEFSDYDNLIFEFNHRNILEKIILLSVAYFSLSIELRFLEEQQGVRKPKQKEKQSRNELKVQTHKKVEELQRSQIFHLKSIEVVCKHIKENSAFVSHLVVNYHKHYKNNLNIIEEENSIAQYSQLYVRKLSKNNASFDEGEMIIPIESVRTSHKDILAPSVYRKDSIYYTDQNQEIMIKVKSQKQKSEETVFDFKKTSKKKAQENQQKSQRSRKFGNSQSFTHIENELNSQKDKTMKKTSSSKMITLGKINDIRIITDRSEKQLSSSKQLSMRSIDKKSLSKSKNFLKNSITLKQNKSQSPQKDRSKAKKIDLKESADFSKRDFAKKKSPQPSRALDLLKKSGSLNELKSSKDLGSVRMHASPTLQMKKKR